MVFETIVLENLNIQLIDGDRGKNYPKHTDFNQMGHCLFLSAKNVTVNGFEFSDTTYISKEKDEQLRAGKLVRGDIVLTTRGTIGNVALYDDQIKQGHIRINSGMMIFRPDPKVWNSRFLYFVLTSDFVKNQIYALTTGSAVPQLPAKDLKKFLLPKVEKEYQDKIVAHISCVVDKITLNRQINQTLEQMAQTLFKSWFVDFDPVIDNALDAGNDIPDTLQERAEQRRLLRAKSDFKPLPAETRALFPSEFEETELGWVPKGWAVESLDQIANFQNGLALQKFRPLNDTDDFLPVLKISDLRQGYTDGVEKARTDIVESCRVYDGDMIFSWSGTLMIDVWTGGNAALNQHLYKVTSQKYPLSFYLYWTKHHLRRFQHIAAAKAVTMGHIKKGDLSDSLCLIPNKEILKKYNDMASNYIEQQINLRLQNNQLSEIRDLLLPKLISGELVLDALPEVPELAEAF